MSEVLEEFIEPYWSQCETEDSMRGLLALATVAWNAALLPDQERKDFLEKKLEKLLGEADQPVKEIFDALLQRKRTHFAANKRAIIDYKLTFLPSGEPYISVVSTLDKG